MSVSLKQIRYFVAAAETARQYSQALSDGRRPGALLGVRHKIADKLVYGKLKAARSFAVNAGVRGTPNLVVNGKYLVRGSSFEDVLRITDALVARERAARRGR